MVANTIAGFTNYITLSDDDAKLMVGAIQQMAAIKETTGVGVKRVQRRDANRADLGGVEISGLLDPDAATGLFRLLKIAYSTRVAFNLRVSFTNAKFIAADWRVESLTYEPVDGDFVMVKGSLLATGGGFTDNI